MSGYFSRIARQSGVRFSGDRSHKAGTTAKGHGPEQPLPIDHEETVMVSSVEASKPRTRTTPATTEHIAVPRGGRAEEPSRTIADQTANKTSAEITAREPAVDQVSFVESDASKGLLLHTEALPPQPDAERVPALNSSAKSPASIDTGKRQTDTAHSNDPENKFFEMTAEVIGARDTTTPEAQQILLREVQQWIAAGPTFTNELSEDIALVGEPMDREVPANDEREPGVVRIAARTPVQAFADSAPESTSSNELKEQSFEISIGSISVVVEGEDTTPPPARPEPKAPSNTRDTPRRTSRLSRHYL